MPFTGVVVTMANRTQDMARIRGDMVQVSSRIRSVAVNGALRVTGQRELEALSVALDSLSTAYATLGESGDVDTLDEVGGGDAKDSPRLLAVDPADIEGSDVDPVEGTRGRRKVGFQTPELDRAAELHRTKGKV